ncbi:MarR family transporter transcriptional regulator [Legionella geestiana]|uniref:MarR family transporter transcriptional regulator n=1 Tax=Legionella geestiana TaxID=45065 RepID=A0A0W0TPH7_9GAMM|nr:MarR family transcriptional regulator [Legionella geestiana]KTC97499.1 MarR family transporter transcriptional regulator [Legionella geestiana]QBS13296.1 MarR family transcriptional regulator [Legionella geestiana]QDQ40886.1 MarR family transcriptional regulator [Legionella geestiana]STX54177.1 transcriptional regulator [Legionella geestiana]
MAFNLEEHTGVLIKKAARLFERMANINLEELGVTYSQTIFLVRLWEKDGQNQKELTKSAGLKQPTVVGILERMERDGLIWRKQNTKDKRCYHFFLTEKAKTACMKLEQQGLMMQSIATRDFKAAETNQLNQSLRAVIHNLEQFVEKLPC